VWLSFIEWLRNAVARIQSGVIFQSQHYKLQKQRHLLCDHCWLTIIDVFDTQPLAAVGFISEQILFI